MKAVILAGGLGRRLRPLTRKIPKPLLPIGGSTAIEIGIRGLAEHGFREIHVATRYKADQIETYLGDGSRYGVELKYSVETEPLGTCGPLSLLKDELTEPFILLNGDVVTQLDFEDVYRFAAEKDAELTVVTKEDVLCSRYGVVRAEGESVTGIEEKPTLSTEVLAGIYVISPTVFDLIPAGRSYGIDELIADLIEQGRGVARYVTDAYWQDVGEIDSYEQANREYAELFGEGDGGAAVPASAGNPPLLPDSSEPPDPWDDPRAAGGGRAQALSEPWATAARLLLSPYAIILSLFVLAFLDHAVSDPVSYSETQTLTYARQFADPDFLPGDWYLTRYQPVRIPFQVLIYPLIKLFPLPTVSLLARLLGYLCVAIALGLIARRLRVNAAYAWIALGAFLWFDQSLLPGEEWIFKRAESKVIAYGLVLFALYALLGKRVRMAGALAGLATSMHILVGGWSTVALASTILLQRLGSWRDRAVAAGLWCLTGSMAIYSVIFKLREPPAPAGFDPAAMSTYFRNPHYLDVTQWDLADFKTIVFFGLLGVLWAARVIFPHQKDYVVTSRFALWTLLPYAAGLAVSPFSFGAELLQLYPFRVADTLIPLLGLLIAVPALLRYLLPPHVRPWVAALLVGVVALQAWGNFVEDLEKRARLPRGGYWSSTKKTLGLYEVCDWIRENTPPGSRLIASPKINVLGYLCERPVVVVFRDVPSGAADSAEWYDRLVAFNDGVEPEERGYHARNEIDQTFNRLPERTYQELGRKYDGRYLLIYDRRRLRLPRLYSQDRWTVYSLADGG